MGRRCVVCDQKEDEVDRLRTDGICVATECCKLRFAARLLRDAHGTETVESAAMDARAAHLASPSLSVTSSSASSLSAAWAGAFAVAKRSRMTR